MEEYVIGAVCSYKDSIHCKGGYDGVGGMEEWLDLTRTPATVRVDTVELVGWKSGLILQ